MKASYTAPQCICNYQINVYTILESGAKEKKRVYEQAVVERRGNFTPIVLSVDGLLHREAEYFLKRLAAIWLTNGKSPILKHVNMLGPDWPLLS